MSDCRNHCGIDSCCSSLAENQPAGDPEYSDVRNEFYKNVDGALLTFDVTCKRSFESLGSWLKEASGYGLTSDTTTTILVVGNKIDHRPREVTEQEVRKYFIFSPLHPMPRHNFFPRSIPFTRSQKNTRAWNSPSRITPPTSRQARRLVWASMTCSSTCCMNERAMKKGGFSRWP